MVGYMVYEVFCCGYDKRRTVFPATIPLIAACGFVIIGSEGTNLNKYIVNGGHPLYGEVTVSGAKNAAVAIIPAALMVEGVCRIENIPQISDVTLFFSILDELGAKVRVLVFVPG